MIIDVYLLLLPGDQQCISATKKMATIRSISAPRTPPRSINLNNKKPPIPTRYPLSQQRSPSPSLDSSVSSIFGEKSNLTNLM